ncbi:MAG: thiamine pyrophosphate-binding protein [Deltaproteobacteria bacterium]|nr:thiamine pyrophosphate-binding protein [Deltaproteobacteria bacterium]MBW2190054.1 thiamine pyrophosphate-binding protein [Deltaproteobacteria bacterium]MBW2223355.1 thiamine pyrophosphate-binding protein [Deltaproteobacteria bacterium]MBW2546527.1 thiamine pyrophosphate-binding protein [Deltaproteobacteria bacterium]
MAEDGGAIIGRVLAARGVKQLFTLCGGHISPILVGAEANDIKVVDVRDEVSAVFAADAVARMTGVPGVVAVTAGPGVTNTITAVKNAQLAQSPLLIFGGAAATLLKGRGALQDIDQLSVMASITKWAVSITKVSSIQPTVEKALDLAQDGVPGPVFLEIPIDVLYPEEMVREMFMNESGVKDGKNLGNKALELYMRGHLYRQFHQPHMSMIPPIRESLPPKPSTKGPHISKVASLLRAADRPALVVGSQALVNCSDAEPIADALRTLGVPSWLGGMARGLLGRHSDIQFRHKRTAALKEADLVIVAGFPFDFRLGYGRSISSRATLVAANLSSSEMRKNRRPEIPVHMHAGEFLKQLADALGGGLGPWSDWFDTLRAREVERDDEISEQAQAPTELVNPLQLLQRIEEKMADDAVLVVDGGDFVATASYILRPRQPLSWLDPGVFGTLGVGGGFAVGASLVRPGKEVWLIYGDGSCAYSLAEMDTCVRHGLAPIAVIGTDGSWSQIAREQVPMLGTDIGTVLKRTAYHEVGQGYGAVGLLLDDPSKIDATLEEAKALAASGKPVVINVHIASTDFRKGSISV